MKQKALLGLTAGVAAIVFALGFTIAAALPPSGDRVVQFGRSGVGSGCVPPDCFDDASFHALDKIVPGSIGIPAGTNVEFDVTGFHRVSIYEPGKKPKDVVVDEGAFPFVNDPSGRIALGGPGADFTFTFTEAGKYLVICDVAPHFEEANMWMWVQVK